MLRGKLHWVLSGCQDQFLKTVISSITMHVKEMYSEECHDDCYEGVMKSVISDVIKVFKTML